MGATQALISKQIEQHNVFIYAMEHYSTFKGRNPNLHTTTWMKFEDIMLNVIS